ncbi:unnamed protein product [Moneuplotes crassus]|uniref:O-acyltransferase WSD1 C-terminal domain-containing protein n=1 Tax=Euplotes crassus TaxID=5936 RepID=A0AAD1XDM6_EUPCR|nr:unnamed protein product [Moneuplotes crassus]
MFKLIDIVVAVVHLSIYGILFYNFGPVYGLCGIYTIYKVADMILWNFFNIRIMRGVDLIMYLEKEKNKSICTCTLILDKNDHKEIKSDHFLYLKNKLLQYTMKNDIFKSKVLEFLGIHLFQVLPDDSKTRTLCAQRIHKIEEDMNEEKDLIAYMKKVSEYPMRKDELQWDLYIHDNYQGDKIVIFGRVHHGISDGMGTMLFLSSVDGNKNLSAIPQMKNISVFMRFTLFLLSPFFFLYSLISDVKIMGQDNPYKLKEGFSGKKELAVSKTYDFEQLRKCYKRYNGMKFNDFFLGCIGTGMKNYANELGYKSLDRVGMGIPVNLRPPPTSLEKKLTFQNCIGLGACEFPCLEDLEKTMKKGKIAVHKRFKPSIMWSSQKIQLMLKYFPILVNNLIVDLVSGNIELAVSNINGLRKPITICGYTLEDSYFITPNVFNCGLCILGASYNKKFRYCAYQDASLEAKAQKLVDHIEKIIEREIDKNDRHQN